MHSSVPLRFLLLCALGAAQAAILAILMARAMAQAMATATIPAKAPFCGLHYSNRSLSLDVVKVCCIYVFSSVCARFSLLCALCAAQAAVFGNLVPWPRLHFLASAPFCGLYHSNRSLSLDIVKLCCICILERLCEILTLLCALCAVLAIPIGPAAATSSSAFLFCVACTTSTML